MSIEIVLLMSQTHNSINRIYFAVCGGIEFASNVLIDPILMKMESADQLTIYAKHGIASMVYV